MINRILEGSGWTKRRILEILNTSQSVCESAELARVGRTSVGVPCNLVDDVTDELPGNVFLFRTWLLFDRYQSDSVWSSALRTLHLPSLKLLGKGRTGKKLFFWTLLAPDHNDLRRPG